MRLAQPTQAVNPTPAPQEPVPAPPEAEVVSYSLRAAEARQRVAERRAELEDAEAEVERLEGLAAVEHRREQQQAETRLLEAQAESLDRGPIAALRSQKAAALLAIRAVERRAARISRSLEHNRQTLTLVEDRTRLARHDGDPEALASLARHRNELAAVIAELEKAEAEARRESWEHQQALAGIEPQLGGYVQGSPAFEVQRLRGRAELLRSLDGQDEDVVRRQQEQVALARNAARTAEVAAEAAQLRAATRAADTESRIAAWRTGQAWLPGARR